MQVFTNNGIVSIGEDPIMAVARRIPIPASGWSNGIYTLDVRSLDLTKVIMGVISPNAHVGWYPRPGINPPTELILHSSDSNQPTGVEVILLEESVGSLEEGSSGVGFETYTGTVPQKTIFTTKKIHPWVLGLISLVETTPTTTHNFPGAKGTGILAQNTIVSSVAQSIAGTSTVMLGIRTFKTMQTSVSKQGITFPVGSLSGFQGTVYGARGVDVPVISLNGG